MKRIYAIFLLTPLIVAACFSESVALVEWDVQRTLKLEKPPLDVAVSAKGRWVFVLTEQGSILIYSSDGTLQDRITVGNHVDGIHGGPSEDTLFLTSQKNKTVQRIVLDFIYDVNISGSPFKGPIDAPVEIAVFNDYQ